MRAWMVLALLAVGACDEKDGPAAEETPVPSNGAGDCTDSAVNAYAGTCVMTFMADCFDPEGECTGEVGAMGDTQLDWANGASVTSTIGTGIPPAVNTLIASSTGAECATGVTTTNLGGGDCFSETVYTRPGGESMSYCTQTDGTVTVTCPDGSSFDLDSQDAGTAQACQYGGAEPCDIDIQMGGF